MELAKTALTPERERDLSRRVRYVKNTPEGKRDADAARNELSLAHANLVAEIAQDYEGMGVPYEDLLQEGYIGLLEACGRWNPYHKSKATFGHYASYWINKFLMICVKQQGSLVRIPENIIALRAKYHHVLSKMTSSSPDGFPPTFEEVTDCMKLMPGARARLRHSLIPVSSFHEECHVPSVEKGACHIDDLDMVERRMDAALLTDQQKESLRMRFGLEHTFKTIGQRFGFSREYARKDHNNVMERLRSA